MWGMQAGDPVPDMQLICHQPACLFPSNVLQPVASYMSCQACHCGTCKTYSFIHVLQPYSVHSDTLCR
jgi:hypothetical protein